VRIALTELRRLRWKDVSLDSLIEQGAPMPAAAASSAPEASAVRTDTMAWLMGVIGEELSDKQRRALMAVAVGGMPLEEVARRMDTKRNALYKLLHDARVALKRRMEKDGMALGEIMRD
jgi:RNA polymerase sigma-70 factor (ECF subfamily)